MFRRPGELDVANAVKWAIENATGIRCLHRDSNLLAAATAATAQRLTAITDQVARSCRSWSPCCPAVCAFWRVIRCFELHSAEARNCAYLFGPDAGSRRFTEARTLVLPPQPAPSQKHFNEDNTRLTPFGAPPSDRLSPRAAQGSSSRATPRRQSRPSPRRAVPASRGARPDRCRQNIFAPSPPRG